MRIISSLVLIALGTGLAAGCAAATTASPATGATPAAAPTADPSPPVSCPTAAPMPTPTPSPTPVASIDPKAPATVYGTQGLGTQMKPDTWTKVDGGRQSRGYEEKVFLSLSDPRVNTTAYVRVNYDYYETEPGKDVATMWGDQRIDGPEGSGGSWEGPCSGSIWEYSHFTWVCWLSGTGSYEGMTFFYDLIHGAEQGAMEVRGHIYPGPVPQPEP